MSNRIKLVSTLLFAAGLSACASSPSASKPSAHIIYAPAIDVSHSEVTKNIEENIGLNVRWGGQIIASEKRGEFTQLTVFANPLSRTGKPQAHADPNFQSGQFIVKIKDYEANLIRRHITVYGPILGTQKLVNGPRSLTVPVVSAIESQHWSSQTEATEDKRGQAYYSLGASQGLFGNRGFRHGFNRGFGHHDGSFGRLYYNGKRFRSHRGFRSRRAY